jgi:beta-propeller repeat-containing protein
VLGARRGSPGVPAGAAEGRRNYLTGADLRRWRSNVPIWKTVRFAGVLDGVDIVYRGGGRRFEYDLEVAPGADPSAIRIAWTGASDIRLDQSGDLVLRTGAGDLVQRKPVAYQMDGSERRAVAAWFRLEEGGVSFDLGPYDRAKPLVIDPIIDYATWFPANLTLVAADSSGASYLSGTISAPVLPVTQNAYQPSCGTDGACNTPQNQLTSTLDSERNSDVFIAKFSPDGSTLIYCTYLGGSGRDVPVGVAVDGSGNVALAGTTTSTDFR